MKIMRCFAVLLSISVILAMQGCGSDTSGALTMTTPTSDNNGDGSYSVSTTVSYTPSGGKSAEGVKINISVYEDNVITITDELTLTSGSNSVKYTIRKVNQIPGTTKYVTIVATIGDMKAIDGTVIDALSPLSAGSIDFIASEAVAPGTTKTSTISGGIGTYSLLTPSPVDGVLTLTLVDRDRKSVV